MKKALLALAGVMLFFTSCEDENKIVPDHQDPRQQVPVDMSDFYTYTHDDEASRLSSDRHRCHSMQVLNRQLEENPNLHQKMYEVEYQVRKFIASKKPDKPGNGNGSGGGDDGGEPIDDHLGIIDIPVYVHVIYNNDDQNISNAQIQSQIDVLNNDFNKKNSGLQMVPDEFSGRIADIQVNFKLAGVKRKFSARTLWGTRDDMKYESKGGIDVVSSENSLNIWVCNIGGGILGYAQFPGGNSATDGIVVSPQYFGTTGYVAAPFDKGRTATHEVGHYLNLRHIWGDGRCNQDDFVADTPASDGPNYGCPAYPTVRCRSNDMTMNYMDYTNDACMNMFSEGQKERMRALFASGGARAQFVN